MPEPGPDTDEVSSSHHKDTVKESDVEREELSTNKDLENPFGRSSSSTSSARRNVVVVDEEKGLAANEDSAKGPADVTDAEHDPNIVDWDDEDDPNNPYNWTTRKKWQNIGILSALTLLTPLGSSFFAPGVPRVMADFQSTSEITATFVVSVQVHIEPPLQKAVANRNTDIYSASHLAPSSLLHSASYMDVSSSTTSPTSDTLSLQSRVRLLRI